MTDIGQGEGQNSSNFAPPASTTQTPAHQAPAPERTFSQSEVNELVGRSKNEAVERYKRETSAVSHAPVPPPSQQQYQPQPPPQAPGVSPEEVKRMAAEEVQRQRNEWINESHRNAQEQEAQKVASEFFQKVEAGKSKYSDYDKKMQNVDLRTIPYHVQLANMVDNTSDVMYDLISNPSKIGAIQNLIDIDLRAGRKPVLALQEMQKLSDSLKTNAKASKFKAPNDPLSQIPPSNAGTEDKGMRTPGDYRRNPAYRV